MGVAREGADRRLQIPQLGLKVRLRVQRDHTYCMWTEGNARSHYTVELECLCILGTLP